MCKYNLQSPKASTKMGFLQKYPMLIISGSFVALLICLLVLFLWIPSDLREAEKKGGSEQDKDLTSIIIAIRVVVCIMGLSIAGLSNFIPFYDL